jgi:formate C-acetyltransferase
MTKSSRFGELTPRMRSFREALLDIKPQICAERAILTTESYRNHADKPLAVKRALMLENILEHMTIYIEPESLLAGNQASANRSAPVFPEYAMDWVVRELDSQSLREAVGRNVGDRGGPVDVALDDVAAEPVRRPQRQLQVDG